MALRGRVRGGRIVLDEPLDLPEGTEVEIAISEDVISAKERADIEAAIDESLEQVSRGEAISAEAISAEEVLRRLRSLG